MKSDIKEKIKELVQGINTSELEYHDSFDVMYDLIDDISRLFRSELHKKIKLSYNDISSEAHLDNVFSSTSSVFSSFPNLKSLNFIHIYNLLENRAIQGDCRECDLDYINEERRKNIFALFLVSRKKAYLSCILVSGEIVFFYPCLYHVLKSTNPSNLADMFFNIFQFYKDQKKIYFEDPDFENLSKSLMCAIMMRMGLEKNKRKPLIRDINKYISGYLGTIFSSVLSNTTLQLNVNKNYSMKLLEMKSAMDREKSRSFEKGMNVGLNIYKVLNNSDYKYDPVTQTWRKQVNIKPEYCYKDRRLYKIPEKHRKYEIGELYIRQNNLQSMFEYSLAVYCTGGHPNVSGSLVCTGDVKSSWNTVRTQLNSGGKNLSCLIDYLSEVEHSLEIINFDSSYYQMNDFYEIAEPAYDKDVTKEVQTTSKDKNPATTWVVLE